MKKIKALFLVIMICASLIISVSCIDVGADPGPRPTIIQIQE